MDVRALPSQPGHEDGLADTDPTLQDEVAAVVAAEKPVDPVEQPLPADKPLQGQLVVEGPRIDVRLREPLVRAGEELVGPSRDEYRPNRITPDRNAALARGRNVRLWSGGVDAHGAGESPVLMFPRMSRPIATERSPDAETIVRTSGSSLA